MGASTSSCTPEDVEFEISSCKAALEKAGAHACGDVAPDLQWGTEAVHEMRLLRAAQDGDLDQVRHLLALETFVDTRKKSSLKPRADEPPSYVEENVAEQEALELGANGAFGKSQGDDCDLGRSGPQVSNRGVGLTPLMCASKEAHPKVITLLLAARANPACQDEDGMTPLHFAAAAGCSESCQLLLWAGASSTLEDDEGRRPRECLPRLSTLQRVDRAHWDTILGPEHLGKVENEEVFGSTPPFNQDSDGKDMLSKSNNAHRQGSGEKQANMDAGGADDDIEFCDFIGAGFATI